jgi:LEA14-like dessication related protein
LSLVARSSRFPPIRAAARALAAFASLAVLLSGCETIQPIVETVPKPTARIVGANLHNLSFEKVDLVFDVEVSNPYAVGLPLAGLAYAIGSGEHTIVRGNLKPAGSIPARGSQIIQVPAIVQFAAAVKALGGVRPGSVIPYRADLTLSVNAPALGPVELPLSQSGELPIPAMPQISLASFDIARLSLDQVKANAKIQLRNTNQFAIDLSKVALSLTLGNQEIAQTSFANSTKLAPGNAVTIYVPLTLSARALGTEVFNLLRGNKAAYSLSGSLETGTPYGPLSLPFKASGTAPIVK